jgi:hypothetical protein
MFSGLAMRRSEAHLINSIPVWMEVDSVFEQAVGDALVSPPTSGDTYVEVWVAVVAAVSPRSSGDTAEKDAECCRSVPYCLSRH